MSKVLLIILAMCTFVVIVSAQQPTLSITKTDVLVLKDKPSLYITFESAGKIKLGSPRLAATGASSKTIDFRAGDTSQEYSEIVWLRLHNNTSWAISLPTNSLYIGPKTTLIRLNDGRSALSPREGLEVTARYEVEVERGARVIQLPVIRRADVSSNTWLAPGRTVLFAVPREHLAKNLMIYIPFNYEWETGERDTGDGNPEHRVYFRASDLPEFLR
jgi:hypothetical protein